MNLTIFISFLVSVLFLTDETFENLIQRRYRVSTISRNRDYSVKGKKNEEIVESRPKFKPRYSSATNKKADCKGEPDHSIAASFNALTLYGDRDILLSFHDDHHDEHCTEAQKHLDVFYSHVNDVNDKHANVLRLLGDGFNRTVYKRCYSKKWHNKFIEFSHCINDPELLEEYHACHDKICASEAYILRNIPAKDQASVICCFVHPQLSSCLIDHVTEHCGRELAEFIASTIYEPFLDYFNHTCGGKYAEHCIDKYPDALKEFNKIYSTKVPPNHQGSYKLLFKIIQNQFDADDL